MKRVGVCVVAAAVAVLWAGLARAERESQSAAPGFGTAKPQPAPRPGMFAAASAVTAKRLSAEQREERRFLKEAAAASRFQADASRMAIAKSNNPAVRSFAATMINHQAATGAVLQHMLHGRGMAPPMLENDQRKILNRLARLNGAKFDREYIEEVGLKYQQEDVQSYERAAQANGDPQLRAWVANTLPTLRYQLATAERIAATADAKLAKGAGVRGVPPVQQPARQAAQTGAQYRPAPPAELATHFMGAGPMQLGATPPGAPQPVAVRPIVSNSR